MDSINLLKRSLQEMKIDNSAEQLEKLTAFQGLIVEKNKTMNLIGPADSREILTRHILDSLSVLTLPESLDWNKPETRILDIGSGGGLPGIPIGIFLKQSGVVLLEKSQKKTGFLLQIIRELSLDNITVLRGRAEELARKKKWRESFSLVTARAVAKFNILLELSIPFCSINGKIIFYKSKRIFNELKIGADVIKTLGGRIDNLVEVEIPELEEFRALLVLSKKENTPAKFPRKFSQIKRGRCR